MRKLTLILVILVIICSFGSACASDEDVVFVDFQTSTDDELQTVINKIAQELESRDYSVEISIMKNVETSTSIDNLPIYIEAAPITSVDSVGGVDVQIVWRNTSNKTMKYVVFTVVPYNRVDDVIFSEVGGRSKINLKVTGPVSEGEPIYEIKLNPYRYEGASTWESVWYNSTINYFVITDVEITYMDNSVETFKDVNRKSGSRF